MGPYLGLTATLQLMLLPCFIIATLFWPNKSLVSHFLKIYRSLLIRSPGFNTARFLWPVGDWINGAPLYFIKFILLECFLYMYLPRVHTDLVSSELFHSQGSYHSSNAECLTLIQICKKTKRQETRLHVISR